MWGLNLWPWDQESHALPTEPARCSQTTHLKKIIYLFLKILFVYLTERETASERGNTNRVSGRGRSRLPAEHGARCGARSQDPGITPWAEGPRLMTEPPRHPYLFILERKRERERDPVCIGEEKGRGRGRESQVDFLQSMGPDAGRYWPEPK